MANYDNLSTPSGSGGPQPPTTPAVLTPCTAAQEVSTVPKRPLPGYAKGSAIDTAMLGSEPIGAQQGKNGPERQKFLCSQCRKKRWVIDSDAGCASEMTRFTICSFCEVRGDMDRKLQKTNSDFLGSLNRLQVRMERSLEDFELRLSELEGETRLPLGTPESHPRLREEFNSLKENLVGDMKELKSMVEAKEFVPRPALPSIGGQSVRSRAESPVAPETYIDDMYRRVVIGTDGLKVSLEKTKPTAPGVKPRDTEVRTASKRSRRSRKKKKEGSALAPSKETDKSKGDDPVNFLIGDSLVGKVTGSHFSSLGPTNRFRSLPGAGVKRITSAVRQLNPASKNTLIISVGGNDLFRRDGVPGNVKSLLKDFDDLATAARSRTGRVVIAGLLPRKFCQDRVYHLAKQLNRKLANLCKRRGVRYVELWDTFFGMDRFYLKDGVHLTVLGAETFAKILSQNLFSTPRKRGRRRRRRRRKPSPPEEVPVQPANLPEGLAERDTNNNMTIEVEDITPDRAPPEKRQRSPNTPDDGAQVSQSPLLKRRRADSVGAASTGSSVASSRGSPPPVPGNGLPPE